MPDTVQQKGNEHGKQVVAENGKEINDKGPLDGRGVDYHCVGVEGVFKRSMVVSWKVVRQRVQQDQAQKGSPEAFHTDKKQRRNVGFFHR